MHYSVETTDGGATSMTTGSRFCEKCGAKIFKDEPGEFCSACALESGLGRAAGIDGKSRSAAMRTLMEFGDYDLLNEIGRGGQGVVYRARQRSLKRVVALKVIALGHWATEAHIKRFRLEAEAAASLDHPRIVPIYEIGERDGTCYFSMKFVEGGRLDEVGTREPISNRGAAELVAKLARTVHYAHQRGILHRDIKPGNILLDPSGEPHLTDFGLARLVEKESTVTRTIEVLGTPSYMAPEQAAGQTERLTTATDVYGLGAVLYQLLTAHPPFAGGTTYETIRQVLETEPRRPSLLNPSVGRDLETICLKCLQKESVKRYGSTEALADDLERFLHDEPIRSRRISRRERAWRWCKRKPVIASLAAALVLALLAGFASVIWELHRAQHEELTARRNLYTADMNLAKQAWEEGNLPRAQSLLRAHLPQRGHEELRGFEWRYLWQLCRDESYSTFPNVNFSVHDEGGAERRDLVLADDGHTVISASGNTLRWIDMHNRSEVQTINVGHVVSSLATAANQPGLLAYYTDKIQCISPTGEQLLGGGVPDESCVALALSPDGKLLASGGLSRTANVPLKLWDVKTGTKLGQYASPGGTEGIANLTFSPDGKYLVCAATDASIQILEVPSLRLGKVLKGHSAWAIALAFDSAGKQLASGGNDGQIILWSFPEGRELSHLTGHRGRVSDLVFASDGRTLVSGARDCTVRVWDLDRPGKHTILHGHRDGVKSVLFSGDGKELYTGSHDGTIKAWRMPSAESENILRGERALMGVTFSPDGQSVAAADYFAHTVRAWDVATRQSKDVITRQHSKPLQRLAFSPDGSLLATGDIDDGVQIWNLAEDKMAFRLPKQPSQSQIVFHPLAPILAVASDSIRFWDARTGREINGLTQPPTHGVNRVAFSPDAKWLALGTLNGSISLWKLAADGQFRQFHSFNDFSASVAALCFSNNGILAEAGNDGRLIFYDVAHRRKVADLQAHTHSIWVLAFAPDNKTLVSTSWDGTIKFWSVANRQLALTLAPGGLMMGVAFSPDGNLMATSGSDGTVRLWPAPSLAEIDAAEKRVQR
jgi:WD40 repeat protein/predicted Ser/Thr protein kinase